jgi:SET domain-containing protein
MSMKYFDDYLYLKKSKIPGAGKGLFTKVDIPKGKIIVEYKGRLVLWKEVKDTDGYNVYLFKLNHTYAIDALKNLKSFGRYANDARGFSKIIGMRNNSEYVTKKNKCFIKSIRKIHKGEEILVPYGKAYWDLIRSLYHDSHD